VQYIVIVRTHLTTNHYSRSAAQRYREVRVRPLAPPLLHVDLDLIRFRPPQSVVYFASYPPQSGVCFASYIPEHDKVGLTAFIQGLDQQSEARRLASGTLTCVALATGEATQIFVNKP
jgi:hypothetical protein